MGCAGELLSTDFGQFGRNNLLIVKDRYSGLLRVYLMPDKTMKTAAKGIERWVHSFRICREVRSDGGPAFGQEFSEYCRSLGIRHTLSSAYNPASNGSAERGVGQIKGLLERIGRKSVLSQDDLNRLVFKLNSNMTAGQGSALQRFFGRNVGTYQMEFIRRKLDHAKLIAKRSEVQKKVAEKLGRRSTDEFKLGDQVLAQNMKTLK